MRYLKTAGGILLYFLLALLALLPVMAIRVHLENTHYVIAVLVWGVCTGLLFIPSLAMIIKKAWFFAGRGEQVPVERLRDILLEVNDLDAPVHLRTHGKKLVASWRHQDQSWCELLEKKGMKKMYELWIGFDSSTKTVTMSDKYRSVNWELSPIKVTTGWVAMSKPYLGIDTGLAWGVENYVDADPADYSFSPNEIKSPMLNTVLKNGWNVRFSLF